MTTSWPITLPYPQGDKDRLRRMRATRLRDALDYRALQRRSTGPARGFALTMKRLALKHCAELRAEIRPPEVYHIQKEAA